MKRIVVVALLPGCMGSDPSNLGVSTQASMGSQPVVLHSTWNGGNANASFGDPMMGSGGFIDFWQGGSTTYLNYGYTAVDPNSQFCMSPGMFCWYTRYSYDNGFGPIPSSDANTTPRSATLNTTITPGGSFYTTHCDIDYFYGIFNCGPGMGGAIIAQWTKTDTFSSFNSGVSHMDFGPTSSKTQGNWWSSSAVASGSLLGHAFTNALGGFGSTRGTNVIKEVSVSGGSPDGGVPDAM